MKTNQVYNTRFEENELPDGCANLIIADPPYFEVKGEFDFIWNNFQDYLRDVEKWAAECTRLLADNGTLYYYGSAKNIAYSQMVFDKHLTLLSAITCHVIDRQTNKIKKEDARAFINTSERLLMYGKKHENLTNCVNDIRQYIREEIIKSKGSIVFKKINEVLGTATNGGGVASVCLSLKKEEPAMMTERMYEKLQSWVSPMLEKEYSELKNQYILLHNQFKEERRPFNPTEKYKMDVLRISQEGHMSAGYNHDTVKPEKLTRILITTSSRKGDVLVVPFAGIGTECAMGVKEGLKVYGFEISKKHTDTANNRIQSILNKPELF